MFKIFMTSVKTFTIIPPLLVPSPDDKGGGISCQLPSLALIKRNTARNTGGKTSKPGHKY